MGQRRPLFVYFLFFSNTNFTEKTVGFCGLQTQIIRVEGEHADHLTSTTAPSTDLVDSLIPNEYKRRGRSVSRKKSPNVYKSCLK